jgi:hypothetical protein
MPWCSWIKIEGRVRSGILREASLCGKRGRIGFRSEAFISSSFNSQNLGFLLSPLLWIMGWFWVSGEGKVVVWE